MREIEETLAHNLREVREKKGYTLKDEIVRHRVASYAQESTRYCNYNKSGDVAFIRPVFFAEDTPEMDNWVDSCMRAEKTYNYLISEGRTPQEARSVLPNSLKTEVVSSLRSVRRQYLKIISKRLRMRLRWRKS